MKVITERTLIRGVAERWTKQYADERWRGSDKQYIGERLRELDGDTATADDVAAVVGNRSWTDVPTCDECGDEDAVVVAQLGQDLDHDSLTVFVCVPCLREAVALTESEATP